MPCAHGTEWNRIVVTFILKRLLYVYAFRLNEPEQSRLAVEGGEESESENDLEFQDVCYLIQVHSLHSHTTFY